MSSHTTPAAGGEDPQHVLVGGLEPLLSFETLAEYVGVPVVTIYRWRTEGKGPGGADRTAPEVRTVGPGVAR